MENEERYLIISGLRYYGLYILLALCYLTFPFLFIGYDILKSFGFSFFTYNFDYIDISSNCICSCLLLFGFRYRISIRQDRCTFADSFPGISFIKKTFPIAWVRDAINKEPYSSFQDYSFKILREDNPWDASIDSDWIEIKHNDKVEFSLGNKITVEKILEGIRTGCTYNKR